HFTPLPLSFRLPPLVPTRFDPLPPVLTHCHLPQPPNPCFHPIPVPMPVLTYHHRFHPLPLTKPLPYV
ncbi:hypothetical protein BYT27DRAFT_7036724, partial [Phlegmacium glaucopus]